MENIENLIWDSKKFGEFDEAREIAIKRENNLQATQYINCITIARFPLGNNFTGQPQTVGKVYGEQAKIVQRNKEEVFTLSELGNKESKPALLGLGTLHTSEKDSKDSPLWEVIDNSLEEIRGDNDYDNVVIIIEDHPQTIIDEEEAKNESEFAYISARAKKLGAEVTEPDPTQAELLQECLRSGFTAEEFFVKQLWGSICYEVNTRGHQFDDLQLGKLVASFQTQINSSVNLQEINLMQQAIGMHLEDLSFIEYFKDKTDKDRENAFVLIGRTARLFLSERLREMDKIEVLDSNGEFDLKIVKSTFGGIEFGDTSERKTKQIHKIMNDLRNKKFLEAVIEQTKKGKKVLLALGEAHIIELMQALNALKVTK